MPKSIYLLDFGDVIKIGHSSNVEQRIRMLSSSFGLPLVRSFAEESVFSSDIEKAVKNEFKHRVKPFKHVVTECFHSDAFDSMYESIKHRIREKRTVVTKTVDGITITPLNIYINEAYNDDRDTFAKSKGVGITQVVRWIKMDCIVINGEVWRRVTVINR